MCELLQRNDEHADGVRTRVQGAVSDLHAADTRYHVDCKAKFMSVRNIQYSSSASTSADTNYDEAFLVLI